MSVPFLDAKNNDCRFPVAGEGVGLIFCGEPKKEGSSFCEACHKKAYLKVSLRPLAPPDEAKTRRTRSDELAELVEAFAA